MVGDFEKRGMKFVGHSEDDVRMEIMELEGERILHCTTSN